MKSFIYNLLSKGLTILLLLALVAVFSYRAELFPHFFNKSAVHVSTEPTVSDQASAVTTDEAVKSQAALPTANAEALDQATAQTSSAQTTASTTDTQALRWRDDATSQGDADSKSADTQSSKTSPADDAIAQARTAYWAGNLDDAVAAYQQAAAATPDAPDVQGELGNIYFSKGDWAAAAAAYLAAGRVLLGRGETTAAQHLVAVLQGLDRASAQRLADELAQRGYGR